MHGGEHQERCRDRIHRVRLRVSPNVDKCTRRESIPEADAMNTVPTGIGSRKRHEKMWRPSGA